jgi:hypothetical protein
MADLRLPSGHIALVDDDDLPAVLAAGPWRIRRDGRRLLYVRRDLSRTQEQRLHRFIMGDPPHDIDHANGNGLDNRRANLRPCDDKLNQANTRIHGHNTSGYRGVSFRRDIRKWVAYIMVDKRQRYLGVFPSAEQAAMARDAAAIEAWGEFARLNFPQAARVRTPGSRGLPPGPAAGSPPARESTDAPQAVRAGANVTAPPT